jgi:biopolymer transport protein ExbB
MSIVKPIESRTHPWGIFQRALLGLLLCFPLMAHAWWNTEWSYRKKISLDGTETPALGGPVQQVLVPVRLHAGNFPFLDAQQNGGDLRFMADDDKTPLNFHVEQFDQINEIAIIWVQVPAVGGKDAGIYMYFGNPEAPAAGSAKAIFDPHTVAVFHFADHDGMPHDATGYGNNVTVSTGKLGSDGAIGFGLLLGSTQSMRIAGAPSLATPSGTGLTVNLWVKAADAAAKGTLLTRDEDGKRLVFGLDAGRPYLAVNDGAQSGRIVADKPIDGASWHHLAFTLGDRARLFVDGQEAATGIMHLPEFKGDLLIGADASGAGGLPAAIDEVQISNMMRPAEWLRAAAIGQHPMSKLAQYGGDESGGGSEYGAVLRTLLNAVSLDGWIVIGLIGILGLISVEVMIVKMRMIGRIKRQNDGFLTLFRDGATPLARMELDAANAQSKAWSESPLFHLFHRGLSEVFNVRQLTGGELTPQALEVVRAGLDATIVEESHRLNGRLVFLTLSVSGAPFLGLLGTVVGIMITFASIAMAGDVNVNTIAPGVAAALTATVSGLVVAIPVLFGYNYLASQIGEITADMEVFANELLGKLALRSSLAKITQSDATDLAVQAKAA